MTQITDTIRDSKRLRLIATALELMQYERTDSAVIPIPGTEPQRYVTVGTAATVARLLEIAPAASTMSAPEEVRNALLEEAAEKLDAMNDSSGDAAAYDQREQNIYELEREHAISACAAAIRALRTTSGKGEAA